MRLTQPTLARHPPSALATPARSAVLAGAGLLLCGLALGLPQGLDAVRVGALFALCIFGVITLMTPALMIAMTYIRASSGVRAAAGGLSATFADVGTAALGIAPACGFLAVSWPRAEWHLLLAHVAVTGVVILGGWRLFRRLRADQPDTSPTTAAVFAGWAVVTLALIHALLPISGIGGAT